MPPLKVSAILEVNHVNQLLTNMLNNETVVNPLRNQLTVLTFHIKFLLRRPKPSAVRIKSTA